MSPISQRRASRASLGLFVASFLAACGGGSGAPSAPAASATPSAVPRAIRIMPIGDSITQGNTETDSYRRPLWRLLQQAGENVDFVGNERDNNGGSPPSPDFDLDHEGHWGWRTDEVLAVIEASARSHRPDVALLHLGSNDVFAGQDDASTLQELAGIVERLRGANPAVKVLLAQLIPTTRPGQDTRIARLNAAIPSLAARLSTPASPVVVVDQYSGFDAARETGDGTHPNAAGEAKMADRWFAAFREQSARGRSAMRPW